MVKTMDEDFTTKILAHVVDCGTPLRWTDIHQAVGIPRKKTHTTTYKALLRLIETRHLVKKDKRYFISRKYYESIGSTWGAMSHLDEHPW